MRSAKPTVAIVDYSLGNLFSVLHACTMVGLDGFITSERDKILTADAVILPGVGAFGDAMAHLHKLDLVEPLRDIAASNRPLIGICLGQQLLMSESYEFGTHKGLNIIEGCVTRFDNPRSPQGILKVPQVGWNRIIPSSKGNSPDSFSHPALDKLEPGEFMYFVHSYYVNPTNASVKLTLTKYGDIEFTSGVHRGNVVAFQFHPERSGKAGMVIYSNLARMIRQLSGREEVVRHAA